MPSLRNRALKRDHFGNRALKELRQLVCQRSRPVKLTPGCLIRRERYGNDRVKLNKIPRTEGFADPEAERERKQSVAELEVSNEVGDFEDRPVESSLCQITSSRPCPVRGCERRDPRASQFLERLQRPLVDRGISIPPVAQAASPRFAAFATAEHVAISGFPWSRPDEDLLVPARDNLRDPARRSRVDDRALRVVVIHTKGDALFRKIDRVNPALDVDTVLKAVRPTEEYPDFVANVCDV